MDIVSLLTSDAARTALDRLEHEVDPVKVVGVLRRSFSREESAALAEIHAGRRLARRKFGDRADGLLYTVEALEQATAPEVARHRANRFHGRRVIADLGCGIGGDAMELPGTVVGVDLDLDRLRMARFNVGERLLPLRADVVTLPPMQVEAVFADPARRDAAGRRVFDVERYSPPLSVLVDRWLPLVADLCVKVHPGIGHGAVPAGAEAEFVSLGGDLREAALWFGSLRTDAVTRATVLPVGATVTGAPGAVGLDTASVGAWLFEPDPAVIRAGLVGDVAASLGLGGIDPTIAYLTGDDPVDSPLLSAHPVESVMPFNAKRIKAHLRSLGVGAVTVKKRGSAVDPEAFRKSLDLHGTEHRTIVLTRAAGKPMAIVCA